MIRNILIPGLVLAGFLVFNSCTKFTKTDIVTGNSIPYYDAVSTIRVEAYINRLYIDLIGREPLDSEVVADLAFLRANNLSMSARETICLRLQKDTLPREGEGSYKTAYCHWFFERLKADLMEGADDVDFQTSLQGVDTFEVAYKKVLRVWHCDTAYEHGNITFNQMVTYMIDNLVYDKINMMTFNYINATYDNLFGRYPTNNEYNIAFDVIENNKSGVLFETVLSNKEEYSKAIVTSREFYNGLIVRGYQKLLKRRPSSAEAGKAMSQLYFNNDYLKFERNILTSDEYAQFEPTYR